ncbi:hypothetical protein HPGCJGGD_3437 [Methylobacterium haplocladii]|nr:hypothetical protein HPGCJGGD_3437 [Methylobacterium haplocladii]
MICANLFIWRPIFINHKLKHISFNCKLYISTGIDKQYTARQNLKFAHFNCKLHD